MSEEIICERNPSQLLNLKSYLRSLLVIAIIIGIYMAAKEKWGLPAWFLLLLVIPLSMALWRFMQIKCEKYELTNERLKITRGVLNRHTEEIELYRIKDFSLNEPFYLRIFKLGNLNIEASDKSMPVLNILAMPQAADFKEKLRSSVEEIRSKKSVREVDFQ